MEEKEFNYTPEQAKFERDKYIIESNSDFSKMGMIQYLGVTLNNYEKIVSEQRKKKLKDKYIEELDDIKRNVFQHLAMKDKNQATEIIVKSFLQRNKIYTTRNDNKNEMWIYDEGIYIPEGKSFVKEFTRIILNDAYSSFLLNQVISKIEADTFISYDFFFNQKYPYDVPVQNGILNIITKELRPFSPNEIFFSKLPVKYNPLAFCPQINKFLSDVLSNENDRKVIYEWGGYALLGDARFEKALMMVGNGRNGKGKTIELLKRVIGIENCVSIPLSSIQADSFRISELFGKRLNLAGDISNTDLKDTTMFKSITGRDIIGGKRKFLPDITFENHSKFTFACNELPMVYDLSRGFWARWILLEFPYTFISKQEYEKLDKKDGFKLIDEDIISHITNPEELSGLLNKFLDALDNLLKNKTFSITQGSEEIKNMWIRKSNSFIAFCIDMIEDDYEGKISKKDLRKEYAKYCKKHKVVTKSDVVIKRVLQETLGASEIKLNVEFTGYQQEWFWTGVRWKS